MAEKQITSRSGMVAFGGSSGSLKILLDILYRLQPAFPCAILIVLHRNSLFESRLDDIIAVKSGLPVHEIEEKEAIVPGHIYIAPADYHVLVEKNKTFSLDFSEKINFSRPSIDVTFKSLAEVYGDMLVCVLLSGANADGAEGIHYAKQKGATTIVQDPDESESPYMPLQAIKKGNVDHIFTALQIRDFLNSL